MALDETTERGFAYMRFTDRYDNKCSMQISSLATEDCIWLGIDGHRMHLSKRHVEDLLHEMSEWLLTAQSEEEVNEEL